MDSISLYEHLDVSFNLLYRLPVELPMRVPHLSHLNLSHNRLTTLPESFALLFHLKTLLIHHNQLQALPETFVHLVKLQRLDVSHNALEMLPETMGNMESLTKLNVSDNFLTVIPPSFGQSGSLRVILAVNNRCVVPLQSICNEGSDAILSFLKKQCKNGFTTETTEHGNIFKRARGLCDAVSGPYSLSFSISIYFYDFSDKSSLNFHRSSYPSSNTLFLTHSHISSFWSLFPFLQHLHLLL